MESKNLDAVININKITFEVFRKPKINEENYVNYTIGKEIYRAEIDKLMRDNNVIGPLSFTTRIEATIRTDTEDPIGIKQYTTNVNDGEFVNKEIDKLLKEGIIQRSYSPYNSPILTVHKKGTDENGKLKRRMVIDFKILNEHTITDRYVIPDINITL